MKYNSMTESDFEYARIQVLATLRVLERREGGATCRRIAQNVKPNKIYGVISPHDVKTLLKPYIKSGLVVTQANGMHKIFHRRYEADSMIKEYHKNAIRT